MVAVNLKVVGHADLGGGVPFDDVAVAGTTAFVAAGGCPAGTVKVVDVRDARRPAVVATVALPPGTVAADLDAAGDLVAVVLAPCADTVPARVAYYDVSAPATPRRVGESPCTACVRIALARRDDGRLLSLRPAAPDALAVDDVTDPARPASVGRWVAPTPAFAGDCRPGRLDGVAAHHAGQGAVVVFTDGRVFDVDLTDPAHPSDGGEAAPPDPATAGRGGSAAVLPLGTRTVAVVAEEGGGDTCPGPRDQGLRLLELDRGVPREREPVRFTTAAAPGRLVASGELAYVAWHGDGLRVVDLGQVRATAVAQFVPDHGDVVGVALLADHLLVSDRSSGLYVLERPDEAGARSSFWSQLAGLLPYLGAAGFLGAAFVVPRLAMGRAPQGTGAPSPTPAPSPRRPT